MHKIWENHYNLWRRYFELLHESKLLMKFYVEDFSMNHALWSDRLDEIDRDQAITWE